MAHYTSKAIAAVSLVSASVATTTLLALLLLLLASPYAQADQTLSYSYNNQGLIATIDGARTDVTDITTFEYDAQGNRTKITNALGHVTQITAYDPSGHPLTLIDPNGAVTELRYDPRGRLISQTAEGNSTLLSYDATGNIKQITQAHGQTLSYDYDDAHRPTGYSDALGNRVSYTLDAAGNRLSETITDSDHTLTQSHQFIYDKLNRLIRDIGAAGQTGNYQYDPNSNLTSQTAPNGNASQFGFDALNRLVDTTDADNGQSAYQYDARDNLIGITDPNGHHTTYSYDAFDNLIGQNSPDTGITSYTVDSAGNRLSQTNAKGITTTYTYDALNRLTAINYPDSSLNVGYQYDENAAGQNGIGRLTTMTDASGITEYLYDKRGNLTTEFTTRGTIMLSTLYAYNNADQLNQITYPNGRTVNYFYDAVGRIDKVTSTDTQGTIQTVLSNLLYQPFGAVNEMVYGNGLTSQHSFDLDARLTDINLSPVLDWQYSYDAVSNIIGIANNLNLIQDQSYSYDSLNRLIDAQGFYGNQSYQYDKTGNRTQQSVNSSTENYSYPVDSHHLSDINGSTFNYDANGNTTHLPHSSVFTDLVYGDHNRLISVNGVTYTYNGKGERINKANNNGILTWYHYDQNGQLIAEIDALGNTQKEYLYLQGQLIALSQENSGNQGNATSAEIILDNVNNATFSDNWPVSTSVTGYEGTNYQYHIGGATEAPIVGNLVDNTDSGFSTTDTWASSSSVSGYLKNNYQYHAGATTSPLLLGTPVDNSDSSFAVTGSWPTSSSVQGHQGANYRHHAAGTGNNTASWPLTVATTGSYDVYVNWTAHANRASNAKYTVNHTTGSDTVSLNQKQNGGQWQLVGTYTLNANTSHNITLSDEADGYVIADAVTLLPAGTPTTGTPQGETASWVLNVTTPGNYDVYTTWTAHANRASDAKYTIHHASGSDTIIVNQQQNGGQWNQLGTFTLDNTSTVDLSSIGNGYVIADAVTLLPAGTPPTEEVQGETATWQANITGSQTYAVYAKWTAHTNRASDANYTIHHANGSDTVTVNQKQNGGLWYLLGNYTLEANSTIQLSSIANGYVIADGIRLTTTTPPPSTVEGLYFVHNDHLGTPQVITDESQVIVWQAEYNPFGKASVIIQSITNNVRFPGQYYDQETGLHYNYYRYYDPTTGRYITSDPIGLRGGLNTYAYVGGNPLSYSDPSGLCPLCYLGYEVGRHALFYGGRLLARFLAARLGQAALASAPMANIALLPSEDVPIGKFGSCPTKGKELQTYWPANKGALGKVTNEKLKPGTIIDRYGYEGGSYVSPAGTPFEMRALPPTTNKAGLNTYKVVKPVSAETATIAPAFNQIGLGIQHKLSDSVGNLIKSGHLERVK